MRIEQLQAFLSVAETGSFQAASHQCEVTQSTVSRQVQALEAELDAPLFHGSGIPDDLGKVPGVFGEEGAGPAAGALRGGNSVGVRDGLTASAAAVLP